ncbi:choline dehydrogenase-like flavoprotein [Chitinophaga polysaccharea]|uniref:Choline dehydrogenase-like flavoprotein n=1 Tax=Chitinophaga polysaccharea TaxID=1293035 RepID=A0A561PXL8_9BACT|nr:GMC family oxidoreductase [Chitinophaga polysaccharea]TWF42847.1 choline dehydrogenase-like flavoprotein [Chitinophaga polysaccharea]
MINVNGKAKELNTYDAIVVGSGISGGWAAKELCEKGLKVLLLERGKQLEHIKDYTTATKAPWEATHRGKMPLDKEKDHPYQVRDRLYTEFNADYWLKDSDSPYKEEKRFDWMRPDIVGGRSIMWGRGSLRLSDLDFEANAKDGIGIDWPIRYKDLAPWYDHVEAFAGISGQKEGIPHLPDGVFQPPMEMNCFEKQVKGRIEATFPGRHMTIFRTANLTQPIGDRGKCQYRDRCVRGCPFGAYFSTQSSTLPAAMKTGNLTLHTDAIVNSIIYDEAKGKATGVRVIDKHTKEMTEYYARILFLNASTLGSTFLLMNSVSNRFPNGLGNDSGVLGHYLMDHHFHAGASGTSDDFADKYYFGQRPAGFYIPRFANVGADKRAYLRGFGYTGYSSRSGWARGIAELGIGNSFKDYLSAPGPWQMGLMGFGECLPYEENQVALDHSVKDAWGQPVLKFNCEFKDNERQMRKDMDQEAVAMLEAAGLKNVQPFNRDSYPGMAIHEMGTARMGRDPRTSVLNEWNQVHAVKNVFVTDGACMTSSACQNPSLTYMAITARAADYAVKALKRQDL